MKIKIKKIWDFILSGDKKYFETQFDNVVNNILKCNFGLTSKFIFVDDEGAKKIVILIDDRILSNKYWYYSDYSINLKNILINLDLIKDDVEVLIGSYYSEYFYALIYQIGENKSEKAFEKINIIKQLFINEGKKIDWLHIFVENDSRIRIVYKNSLLLIKAHKNGNFALLCSLIADTILRIDHEGLLTTDIFTFESCILRSCNLFAEFHG